MHEALAIGGRLVLGAAGVFLICAAIFLRPKEESSLENVLETWWVRIDDLQKAAISRQLAFFKIIAAMTSKVLRQAFGERLFGLKAIAASMCYSQVGLIVFVALIYRDPLDDSVRSSLVVIQLLFALGFLTLGSFGFCIHTRRGVRMWVVLSVISMALWLPASLLIAGKAQFIREQVAGEAVLRGCIIAFGIASDVVFIAFSRLLMRRASKSNSSLVVAGLGLVTAATGILLVIVPWEMSGYFSERWWTSESKFDWAAQELLPLFASTNILDAFLSLLFFVVAALMLLHRLVWPVIERPVFAICRYHVFLEQKKVVFAVGAALLGIAFPQVGAFIRSLGK